MPFFRRRSKAKAAVTETSATLAAEVPAVGAPAAAAPVIPSPVSIFARDVAVTLLLADKTDIMPELATSALQDAFSRMRSDPLSGLNPSYVLTLLEALPGSPQKDDFWKELDKCWGVIQREQGTAISPLAQERFFQFIQDSVSNRGKVAPTKALLELPALADRVNPLAEPLSFISSMPADPSNALVHDITAILLATTAHKFQFPKLELLSANIVQCLPDSLMTLQNYITEIFKSHFQYCAYCQNGLGQSERGLDMFRRQFANELDRFVGEQREILLQNMPSTYSDSRLKEIRTGLEAIFHFYRELFQQPITQEAITQRIASYPPTEEPSILLYDRQPKHFTPHAGYDLARDIIAVLLGAQVPASYRCYFREFQLLRENTVPLERELLLAPPNSISELFIGHRDYCAKNAYPSSSFKEKFEDSLNKFMLSALVLLWLDPDPEQQKIVHERFDSYRKQFGVPPLDFGPTIERYNQLYVYTKDEKEAECRRQDLHSTCNRLVVKSLCNEIRAVASLPSLSLAGLFGVAEPLTAADQSPGSQMELHELASA